MEHDHTVVITIHAMVGLDINTQLLNHKKKLLSISFPRFDYIYKTKYNAERDGVNKNGSVFRLKKKKQNPCAL